MGPKSKTRIEFMACKVCGCSFSAKDKEKHTTSCTVIAQWCSINGSVGGKLPHGFIRGTCLTTIPQTINVGATPKKDGRVSETPSKEGTSKNKDPLDKVPKNLQNDIVLLNVSAMQLLRFGIGSPVIVQSDQTSDPCPRVLKAWPNQPSSDLLGVGFINCATRGLLPTQLPPVIKLSPLAKPYYSAKEVRIKPKESKGFGHTPEFIEYIHRWCDGRFLTHGNTLHITYFGQPCQVEVSSVKGQDTVVDTITHDLAKMSIEKDQRDRKFFRIVSNTKFILDEGLQEGCESEEHRRTLSLDQIGGIGNQVEKLKELMDLHFKKKSCAQQGLSLPKGILLHGPSGTGKTMLAQAVMKYAGVKVVEIQGTELWSRYYGESETRLAAKFQEAKDSAPSIVFIDEVDAVCPKRQSSNNEVEKRVVSSLMTLMDKALSAEKPVIIIAATNKLSEVDPGLRRPGRLEREMEIGVPSAKDRVEIMKSLLLNTTHTLSEEDLKNTAAQAHGFVGADLAAVCKEAGIMALKSKGSGDIKIELNNVMSALQTVQPSAMREVALEISQVSWQDIGGQAELKHKLKQAIEWPRKHPESFTRLGIRPPRGLLMYGPPGCSKTMIAKALAHESGLNFIAIKGPELFSKWVGESERAVREIFRKARAAAPAIIFFDEIDSIAGERGSHSGSGGGEVGDRVLAQMLTEMDGVVALQDVTIVAATNRPERIDKALLRPGRLDRIVYVPLPDKETRKEIFTIHFRKTPVADDIKEEWLAEKTDGYSGAEVSAVCHEAALSAMQEDLSAKCVQRSHFETALCIVTPRIKPEVIKSYDDYAKQSGLHSL